MWLQFPTALVIIGVKLGDGFGEGGRLFTCFLGSWLNG